MTDKIADIHVKRRITPRIGCPEPVARVFRELVDSVDGSHFAPADGPLVEAYAQAIVLGRTAYEHLQAEGAVLETGKTNPWLAAHEKSARAATALSARLRLCPQSRFSREKAGSNSSKSRRPSIDSTR